MGLRLNSPLDRVAITPTPTAFSRPAPRPNLSQTVMKCDGNHNSEILSRLGMPSRSTAFRFCTRLFNWGCNFLFMRMLQKESGGASGEDSQIDAWRRQHLEPFEPRSNSRHCFTLFCSDLTSTHGLPTYHEPVRGTRGESERRIHGWRCKDPLQQFFETGLGNGSTSEIRNRWSGHRASLSLSAHPTSGESVCRS